MNNLKACQHNPSLRTVRRPRYRRAILYVYLVFCTTPFLSSIYFYAFTYAPLLHRFDLTLLILCSYTSPILIIKDEFCKS